MTKEEAFDRLCKFFSECINEKDYPTVSFMYYSELRSIDTYDKELADFMRPFIKDN
jgi:hypothetical protein